MPLIWLSLVFFLSRLINLTLIPVFADEAIYIRWAQLITSKSYYFFIPLSDGKTPFFMWLLAPLTKIITEPLIAGRLLSVLAGFGALLGVYYLTKKLFNPKAAIVAAFIYLIQPFALFYDRLSLVDSLLTATIVWSVYWTLELFDQPSWRRGIILGLIWGAALLTKPTALLFLGLIPFLLLIYPVKRWLKIIKTSFWSLLLAAGLGVGLYSLQRFSDAFYMINLRSADYLRDSAQLLKNPFQFLSGTVPLFFDWLISYLSWPFVILILITILMAVKNKTKPIYSLAILVILPFLVQAATAEIFYPRYLLPILPFLVIIVAAGTLTLWNSKPGQTLVTVLGLTSLIFFINFNWLLLTDPVKTPLHLWEKHQYFYDWSAGYGIKETVQFLKALPQDQEVLVATEGSFGTLPNGLQIFFHRSPRVEISGVGFPETTVTPGMEAALDQGKTVYLLVNAHRYNLSQKDRLRLIAEYPRPAVPNAVEGEKLVLYEVH